MKTRKRNLGRQTTCRPRFTLHPLFIAVGIWYSFTGELFLFLLSCLVALQHECAHAFAAAKLGYKLNKIVLMPYGAVIDGDLQGISLKDEITVALWGPLCNLCTAAFFAALWWFYPTTYAFTDTACFSSLSIALINLLPAYPLDGGRIFRCALEKSLRKNNPDHAKAAKKADRTARVITLLFSAVFLALFVLSLFQKVNFTTLAVGAFLLFGAIGNRNDDAVYQKISFSMPLDLKKGVELRRVAVLEDCPVKDALRFIERGSYLVLEVYSKSGARLLELPQNRLAEYFAAAQSPYEPICKLAAKIQGNDGEKSAKKV